MENRKRWRLRGKWCPLKLQKWKQSIEKSQTPPSEKIEPSTPLLQVCIAIWHPFAAGAAGSFTWVYHGVLLRKPRNLSVCFNLTTPEAPNPYRLISEHDKVISGIVFALSAHTAALQFFVIFDSARCLQEIWKLLLCFRQSPITLSRSL